HLFRTTRAEHERDVANELNQRGVTTFRPIAVGTIRRHGSVCESLLLSHAVRDAVPLDDLPKLVPAIIHRPTRRHELIRACGTFLGRLHSLGGDHRDLHAGNLLVGATSGGSPLLTLIDLQALRVVFAICEADRWHALATLHQTFVGQTTRSDRLRFWRAYQSEFTLRSSEVAPHSSTELLACTLGWPPEPGTLDARAVEYERLIRLETLLADRAIAGWRRADRAWARGNRHVRILQEGAHRLRGLATLPMDWLREIAASPEQLFAADAVKRYCKQTARCRVALAQLPSPAGPIAACVKSVISKRWVARILSRGRWSLVRRSWEMGHALRRRGIDTPRPLFCVETRTSRGIRGYLATEWIGNTQTAQQFIQEVLPGLPTSSQQEWLNSKSKRLAGQLRRLHNCGFDHRDLKLANLLVSNDLNESRVWLLDLDGVRSWKRLPRHRAVQNLSRLAVSCQVQGVDSQTTRLRFLKYYLAGSGEDWRVWWRLVERSGEKKKVQNARRGRPIS
ncbi:MAG: hypothetical protein NT069_19355, partial [Planctomycetota bacterium]|nr:hypothetical protein [Planctomycetota bacterium]